ncbi:hypothetical protein LSH36_396g01033 [Paralvinella palmiformis]|uniref:Uncharacterized protein n=1 Tax=Paralvinella palmiformis TaxID=53620 RepID=A0AAD9N0M0_9ANNE|nr:hypothetical protein LSH36_396g01033 [Paralvinella palmiformis]
MYEFVFSVSKENNMSEKKFDSVSWGEQSNTSCVIYLGLNAMQTKKKLGGYKPTNTEIPSPVRDDDNMMVTAIVQNDNGNPDTYVWVKRHQDNISSVKVKVDSKNGDQLKVTLIKSKKEAWLQPFQSYLLQL